MFRCLELAGMGAGYTAPNPLVGSVLVYQDRIIGEGYHRQYGEAHAEVNCLQSVADEDQDLIASSTLYVSLEPCAHHGKTPPCSDLIIRKGIKKVVIGCRDPFPEVDGKGIEKLKAAGIAVTTGVLGKESEEINRRFFCWVKKKRPYVIVKWAQSANGKIAGNTDERVRISNDFTNRLVHRWRSEEAAILVGSRTALLDNPALTNRLWTGKQPVRMVLDHSLQLPANLQLFDQQTATLVFNDLKEGKEGNIAYCLLQKDKSTLQQVLQICYERGLQSILVEGGAQLLQHFIREGLWDEARIITNEKLFLAEGLSAPVLPESRQSEIEKLETDSIQYLFPVSLTH
ncbi:MAG: bifunctional diaminohydroxyphosphoribosylaminopyrimidine deaminase/5-amino-6-(5-phosphoribosylamino)uracil reductase RibD [Bacteroidota bacterium]|nr:bifunctional diaminohydroxyphosphoribosylaminopyrimidine deaminase/5-amino-6-(5-phosphoribosylamino)uracil reductase RibD [Bacteroidota bacterium]